MPSTERPAGTSSLNAVRMIAFAALVVVGGVASIFGTPARAQAPRYGTAVFRIKIPAPATAASPLPAGSARPLYVSASTKSLAILTDGKNRLVANADRRGYGYIEVRLHPTVGTHIFTVTAYDRPGAQGNILSLGTAPPVTVPASGNALVDLTLEGVVASVTLALDQSRPIVGSPAIIHLTVVAKDADGNAIIYPQPGYTVPFASPITLTSSDPINGKLSQISLTGSVNELPADFQRISVAYSGANVGKIVFSATGRGLTPASITPAVLIPLPPPKVAEQIMTTGGLDPNAAFSTSNGQFLGTIGAPPFADPSGHGRAQYGMVFVDDAARLAYIFDDGVEFMPPLSGATRFDIFQTSGARALVDSFDPGPGVQSLAIDSRAQRIYADSIPISIFSTTRGHARLGTLPPGFSPSRRQRNTQGPNFGGGLAIDLKAHRLYVIGCNDRHACGFYVISTISPYPPLGSSLHGNYSDIALDSAGGKVYLSDSSHINVYRTSDINRKVAMIGNFGGKISGIAIDTWGRRLYVLIAGYQSYFPPYNSNVQVYDIDNGSLLGSIPILYNLSIAVAPYN